MTVIKSIMFAVVVFVVHVDAQSMKKTKMRLERCFFRWFIAQSYHLINWGNGQV
jgi:hypothetical protein